MILSLPSTFIFCMYSISIYTLSTSSFIAYAFQLPLLRIPTKNHDLSRQNSSKLAQRSSSKLVAEIDVDLYNENGEEITQQLDLQTIEEEIDEYYSVSDKIMEEQQLQSRNEEDATTMNNKKLIECSASIMLPFSEEVAFDAFSDLTRQPSWCKYLHSVEYIGLVHEESESNTSPNSINNNIPLRQSKWTVSIKNLRFSWTASDTSIIRPHRIEWQSTSGLSNMGSVEFTPQSSSSSTATEMTICFKFITPRVVSSLFRRSVKIRQYTEDVLLGNMLSDFRDAIVDEMEEDQ